MHRFAAVLLPLLLTACAATPHPASVQGALELLAPLAIPPESATVRLQYGHPVARNAVQEHDPFCIFELETVADSTQTVQPDRFRILDVAQVIDSISATSLPGPIRVSFSDRRPSHLYFKTRFRLASEQQPRVRMLTCMSNQFAPGNEHRMRHLTLQEMRDALGTGFRLEPGHSSSP